MPSTSSESSPSRPATVTPHSICSNRPIALLPNHPEIRSNLGEVYRKLGHSNEAIAELRRALEIQPDYAEALSNLGNALVEKGGFAEAIAACRRAVELKPAFAAAHNNLGNALRSEGESDKAIAAYRRAMERRSDYAEAHSNLGTALAHQGILDQALAEFRIALQLRPDDAEEHSNLLLILQSLPNLSPEEIFRDHCRWDEVHARPLANYRKPHTNDPSAERRLRIRLRSRTSGNMRSPSSSRACWPATIASRSRCFATRTCGMRTRPRRAFGRRPQSGGRSR